MRKNVCPVCGPVGQKISSRYCVDHLRELLARCLEMPAGRGWRDVAPEPAIGEWLRPEPAIRPAIARRRAA
jgi:hypothetical protein